MDGAGQLLKFSPTDDILPTFHLPFLIKGLTQMTLYFNMLKQYKKRSEWTHFIYVYEYSLL